MRKPLLIALIWMLMLALPAQGMAALTIQLCALIPQGGAMVQLSSYGAVDHCAAMVMDQPAEPSAHVEHHVCDNHSESVGTTDNSLCSLCTFCVGAVALNTVVANNSPLQAVGPFLVRLEQFVGFIAEAPERPPRLFLA